MIRAQLIDGVLSVQEQGLQDVVELVRYTAGEGPDGGQPLLMPQLGLQRRTFGLFDFPGTYGRAQSGDGPDQLAAHELQVSGKIDDLAHRAVDRKFFGRIALGHLVRCPL